MRLLISILMAGQLMACVHPLGNDQSEKAPYRPRPNVEVSAFTATDGVMSAYVRHSGGGVLFHLSPQNADYKDAVGVAGASYVLTLSCPDHVAFTSIPYENFEQSFDMFQDGRIVLVPLPEGDGTAAGAFVNLLSGRRYFFAPSLRSSESMAKIRSLANNRRDLTVIVPEDGRANERVAQFPAFQW